MARLGLTPEVLALVRHRKWGAPVGNQRRLNRDRWNLTRAERRVIYAIALGLSRGEIMYKFGIARGTYAANLCTGLGHSGMTLPDLLADIRAAVSFDELQQLVDELCDANLCAKTRVERDE